MRLTTLVFLLSLTSQALHPQGTPALDAVARAMGGKDRVLAVRTLIVEGSGTLLYFGQTHTPYAETNMTLTAVSRSYDFVNRRTMVDQQRESRFLTPMPRALRVRFGVDGEVGYNVIGDGPMTRVPSDVAADRSAELIYHPVGFIQAAYAPGSRVTEDLDRGVRRIRLSTGGMSYAMHLDRRTSLPIRVSRVVAHPMLGDVTLRVEPSGWRKTAGLQLPTRIVQRQDRWMLSDYRFTSARTEADPGDLAAADSVRAAIPPAAGNVPPLPIDVEELVPGVWLVSGPPFNGAHYYTIAIEQSDRVVLVEAPENDARTLAIIAKARELRPGKPLGPMVNTHHHFDHAGGVRAAISQGLAIITHAGNREFFGAVVYPGRHTIRPDALQANPRPLRLTGVRDRLVLGDPMRTIELYEVRGDDHSGSMLMVYLPAERILIQADLNGEDSAHPVKASLVDNVRRLGLRVDRVVGIHGRPVPWPSP